VLDNVLLPEALAFEDRAVIGQRDHDKSRQREQGAVIFSETHGLQYDKLRYKPTCFREESQRRIPLLRVGVMEGYFGPDFGFWPESCTFAQIYVMHTISKKYCS
jgi:hypothetical protein